jgi:hypothetical protein
MVNSNFELVYANTAYLSFLKEMTGLELKLNESLSKDYAKK